MCGSDDADDALSTVRFRASIVLMDPDPFIWATSDSDQCFAVAVAVAVVVAEELPTDSLSLGAFGQPKP